MSDYNWLYQPPSADVQTSLKHEIVTRAGSVNVQKAKCYESVGRGVVPTTTSTGNLSDQAAASRAQLALLDKRARSVPRLTSIGLARRHSAEYEAKSSEAVRPSAPSAKDVGEA